MAKSIRLLGATYSDVPAVDLPKTGGGTARFADIDETALVVTLSWDDEFGEDGGWVPDCTFAEVQAAYEAGRPITFEAAPADFVFADGYAYFDEYGGSCEIQVYDWSKWTDEPYCVDSTYIWFSDGYSLDYVGRMIEPNFDSPTRTYTPSAQQQTETITYDSAQGYNGIQEVEVTVEAVPAADEWAIEIMSDDQFVTQNNTRKWQVRPGLFIDIPGWLGGDHYGSYETFNAVAANTSVTPTESAQTIGGARYMMEGAVTVNAIPSSYVGSGITRRSGSDLTASGDTVSVPAGYYQSAASKAIAAGSATPSATKGSVSNHSVQVTPSVTRTAGYVSAGTSSGTPVTVQASELVSGSQTITENSTVDVTNLASVVVAVQGGSTGLQIGTATSTPSSASQSIQFTGLSGEPTSFYVVAGGDLSTAAQAKTAAVVFDGTAFHGQTVTNTSNAQASYVSTGWSKSYSSGTLTITGTSYWQAVEYTLVYTYGGSAANLGTDDVQVGSGATSISFTGLSEEPSCWSAIFKSDFGTSSGYQRVMAVVSDGNSIEGMAMGSGGVAESSWSASYSNGTLTISSQSTSAGGYFHQPGYYQLTYATGGEAPPIEVEPLSVTENGTYTAPRGTAYSPVTVNVASGGGASVDTKTVTASNRPSTISFTSMKGQPKMFALRATFTMTSSSTTYYYVDSMRGYLSNNSYSVEGRLFRMGSTRETQAVASGYSASYSGTTLTLTSTGNRTTSPGCFYNGSYELVYVY